MKSKFRWWILTNTLGRLVFLSVLWKRKNINCQDGDVFNDRIKHGFAPLGRMMPVWTREALEHLKKKP